MYLVGGDTTKKIIYNMMNKLITNDAATSYSGQGRKKKISFINLKLYDAIISKYLPLVRFVTIHAYVRNT